MVMMSETCAAWWEAQRERRKLEELEVQVRLLLALAALDERRAQ